MATADLQQHFDVTVSDLHKQIFDATVQLVRIAKTAESLPRTDGQLRDMLNDLARAELACQAFFKNNPRDFDKERPADQQEEWGRLWQAREAAATRIYNYAVAQYTTQSNQ